VTTYFNETSRFLYFLPAGTSKSYFLKVAQDEQGRQMMHGEFESMSALYKVVPDFVPKPHAWGSYKDIEDTHFFLCDFQWVDRTCDLGSRALSITLS
jgi:protein-ribulosamine 3-kinase